MERSKGQSAMPVPAELSRRIDPGTDREILDQLLVLIRDNFKRHREPYFYMKQLQISERHLNRIWKAFRQERFVDMIDKLVFEEASNLLIRTDMKVLEIAADLGYNSSAAFANTFRKMSGLGPKAFRKLIRTDDAFKKLTLT